MRQLPPRQREASIAALPKAELHLHLDGSVRPATLAELARSHGVALPADDPDTLARLVHPDPNDRSLRRYLEAFDTILPVMQREDALERIAFELIEDCAAENHRYVEVRYAPVFLTRGVLDMERAVRAVHRGLKAAHAAFGIESRQILCAMRHLPVSEGIRVMDLAAELIPRLEGPGSIGGVDLAGGEADHPTASHRETFAHASRLGLRTTIHAGEAAGPESVAAALDALGATRIGHGVALARDAGLRQRAREADVTIEVCPTSNVQTGAVPSIAEHPAIDFLRQGLRVAVCTDNRTVSATTLTRELELLVTAHNVTVEELRQLTANAFEAAFLPDDLRTALRTEALREFDQVTAGGELPGPGD